MIPNRIGKLLLYMGLWGCTSACLHAQIAIDSWRTHYAYGQSYAIAQHEGSLYSHALHSLLRYDPVDGTLTPFTAVEGLHTASIVALASSGGLLVVGYSDGQIDVLRDGTLSHLTQLQESPLQLPKTIYTAFASSAKLYVGGAYGLLAFDKQSLRLENNYIELGHMGNRIGVYAGTLQGDSLFLATEEGLIHAGRTPESALLDYRTWKRPRSGQGSKEQLVTWQQGLYSLASTPAAGQLLRYQAGRWQLQMTLGANYTFLRATHKGLIIGAADALQLYTGHSQLQEIALPAQTIKSLQDATYIDETLWVSDALNGLGRLVAGHIEWMRFSAPTALLPHSLHTVRNTVYAFYRGPSFPQFRAFAGGFSVFEEHRWHDPAIGALTQADVVDVLQPLNGPLYIATYSHGVWQQQAGIYRQLAQPSGQALAAAAAQTTALAHMDGVLLVATHNSPGASVLRYQASKGWSNLTHVSSLSGSFADLISQAGANQVWGLLRHSAGAQIVVFSPQDAGNAGNAGNEGFQIVPTHNNFNPQQIYALALDAQGRLWIGTLCWIIPVG